MNVIKLREKIKESGITFTALAQKTGMSRETLYNRLNNPNFRLSETVALAKALHLSEDERIEIFFDDKVN